MDLFLSTGPPAGPQESASLGLALLVTLVLLLGLFVVGVVLLTRSYLRRNLGSSGDPHRGGRSAGPEPDAWSEAGRRLQVPDDHNSGSGGD